MPKPLLRPSAGTVGVSLSPSGSSQSGASVPLLIQQKVATTADASALLTTTFDAPCAAGRSVIACISYVEAANYNDVPALVDGSAAALTIQTSSTATGVTVEIYFLEALFTTGGETGVAFRLDVPVRASINISEWSGLSLAAAQDISSGTNAGSTTLAVVPATLDATTAPNLVIGIGGYVNATDAYSSGPTNSFTRLTQTGGASIFQECAYLIREADHAAVTSDVTLGSSLVSASCAAAFGGV